MSSFLLSRKKSLKESCYLSFEYDFNQIVTLKGASLSSASNIIMANDDLLQAAAVTVPTLLGRLIWGVYAVMRREA